jgi:hypothetical protein
MGLEEGEHRVPLGRGEVLAADQAAGHGSAASIPGLFIMGGQGDHPRDSAPLV